jgi:hypothetical protein
MRHALRERAVSVDEAVWAQTAERPFAIVNVARSCTIGGNNGSLEDKSTFRPDMPCLPSLPVTHTRPSRCAG